MPNPPGITGAEWHIMKILWDHPTRWFLPAEIIEPLAKDRNIHHRTIRTLLARLVKKNAVETRPAPSASPGYLYHAKIPRLAVTRAESRSFLSRVFDGNAAPALVHFLKESNLSPEDLKNLRALLKQKENP